MPSFSPRAYPAQITSIFDVFQYILAVISNLIPLLVGLAILVFLWGLFKFLRSSGNESDYTDGRNIMVYGVIGIFVMTAIWGLIAVLDGTFGFTGVTTLSQ